jgi:glucose/arabinose dehydrogenase
MKQWYKIWFLLVLSSWASAQVVLREKHGDFELVVEEVTDGLGVPWGLSFVSPNQLLVTEREGRAALIDTATGSKRDVQGLPSVYASGQGGLLDVAVPPDYRQGGWIYFTYSKDIDGQGATTLARAKLQDNQLQNWTDLLITKSTTDTTRHYGSRITFDNEGFLYFGVGDRGVRPNGQNLSVHAGSILRLHVDGRVPEDNPFVGRNGALPEIWSYGHRNPQGLAFDYQLNRLWEIEHGPRGGDEINRVFSGRNYGWPIVSLGFEYWGPFRVGEATEKPGIEPPIKTYVPSIAPSSLLMYSGDAFPTWRGSLIAGALKLTHLNRVELDGEGKAVKEERLLESLGERIRALIQSPEGWIYLSTDSGKVMRVRPGN